MGISRRSHKQQIRARIVEKTDAMSAPVGLAVARSFGDRWSGTTANAGIVTLEQVFVGYV